MHNISAKGLKVTRKTLGAVQDVSVFLIPEFYEPDSAASPCQAIGGVITHVAEPVFKDIDEYKQSRTPPQSAPPSRRSSAAPGSVPPYFNKPNMGAVPPNAVAGTPPPYNQGNAPPVPGIQNLSVNEKRNPPPVPPRVQTGTAPGGGYPSAAQEKANIGGLISPTSPTAQRPQGGQTGPSKPQRGFWNRVFTAAEVIGTSLEATTSNLVTSTTNAASTAAG